MTKSLITMLARIGAAAVICLSQAAAQSTTTQGLDALDFMTGVWRQSGPDAVIEEWWMPAEGGTKVAAFRWVQGEKIIAIELVIIREEQQGTFLRFKHYSGDYEPWEKDGPNVYRLEEADGDKAVFAKVDDNPNTPPVIIYERTTNGLRFRGTSERSSEPLEGDLVLDFKAAEPR